MNFFPKVRTAARLGAPNLLRVLRYRLGVKIGLNPVRRLSGDTVQGAFFSPLSGIESKLPTAYNWQKNAKLFSYLECAIDERPPQWHANPITGHSINNPLRDWWQIPDFDPVVGDIKQIWEFSRFDWVLNFAQHACSGDLLALDRLNAWLNDWCIHNPPYKGPNWKCGQEASIRVMHLAMAALMLGQTQSSCPSLLDLIELHLQRIEPTLGYAMAQDNNHGTSEAAALFIGGSWLQVQGRSRGSRWYSIGRRWLENRARRLIGEDGSFSQYSLNYHRVMLDTLSMAEVWRRHLGLEQLSAVFNSRAVAAAHWLLSLVNGWNGDGPNLGANDGARLLQLTDADYRDYRPSVQLATALFAEARAYEDSESLDLPLHWLGVRLPEAVVPEQKSEVFDDGGIAILRQGSAMAMLRYPRFRFRPSHADALHVDLWLKGRNLLRDGGTYSYNTDTCWLNYFPGTESHNTVQFDDRDQMPRLSRFLFGDWLKTKVFELLAPKDEVKTIKAGYRNWQGVSHTRSLYLEEGLMRVVDQVEGFAHKAVLRWRLEPGPWELNGTMLSNGEDLLSIASSEPLVRCELRQGWESRYYMDKQPLPVLEVEIQRSGTLITEYRWTP